MLASGCHFRKEGLLKIRERHEGFSGPSSFSFGSHCVARRTKVRRPPDFSSSSILEEEIRILITKMLAAEIRRGHEEETGQSWCLSSNVEHGAHRSASSLVSSILRSPLEVLLPPSPGRFKMPRG